MVTLPNGLFPDKCSEWSKDGLLQGTCRGIACGVHEGLGQGQKGKVEAQSIPFESMLAIKHGGFNMVLNLEKFNFFSQGQEEGMGTTHGLLCVLVELAPGLILEWNPNLSLSNGGILEDKKTRFVWTGIKKKMCLI